MWSWQTATYVTVRCCCLAVSVPEINGSAHAPALPIKTAFSSQHVWLFDAGPGLDAASIAIRAWFIRSQEHCSACGDHFMNYGHRNMRLKNTCYTGSDAVMLIFRISAVIHVDVRHVYIQADSLKPTVCLFWNSLTFVLEVNKMFNKSSRPILLKRNIFPKIWHKSYKTDAAALNQLSLNCKFNISL